MSAAAPSGRLWSIQYLRAAAAIAVVFFHQFRGHNIVFAMGEHGVDIFFVISGFIMVALTQGRPVTPARFVLDRITRIVPLYWLATLLAFAMVAAGLQFYAATSRIDLLLKSLFFVPEYNAMGRIWPTMFLGWTLNFEIFFYALFALALFAPARLRLPILAIAFGLLVVAGVAMPSSDPRLLTYTRPIILEFLAGAALGTLLGADLRRSRPAMAAIGVAALAAILGALSLVLPDLFFAWPAVLLVGGGLLAERQGWMPRLRWLAYLGDASFSIYLFQQFGFELVRMAYAQAGASIPYLRSHGGIEHLASALVALVLGVLVFRFVERPLTRGVRALTARATGVLPRLRAAPAA